MPQKPDLQPASYLITSENIVLNFDNRTFIINKNSEARRYEKVKEYVKTKNWNELITYLIPKKRILKYANEYFEVTEDGKLYLKDKKDEEVPVIIAKRLMTFLEEDLDLQPLIMFWKNLRDNPSNESKKDLYLFLEKNNHPITPEGNFIAYKKVNKQGNIFVDNHSRKIDNSIGKVVEMPREKVNPNRNETCSHGLHVASMEYAKGYSGDILVEVIISPKDVVSVPIDYNNQKMRVCRYKVLGVVKDCTVDSSTEEVEERKETFVNVPKGKDIISKHSKPVAKEKAIAGRVVDFAGLTAKQIISEVDKLAKIYITTNPSDKKGVIKKATKILTEKGFIPNF